MGNEIQPVVKTIDGEEYTFYRLPPRHSTKILVKILKMLGPSVGSGFKEEKIKVRSVLDVDIDIGKIITTFFDKLDLDELQGIIDVLFTTIIHKGEGQLSNEATYTKLFQGKQAHLYKVLFSSLEVEYGNFFGESKGLRDVYKEIMKEMAQENQPIGNTIQEK